CKYSLFTTKWDAKVPTYTFRIHTPYFHRNEAKDSKPKDPPPPVTDPTPQSLTSPAVSEDTPSLPAPVENAHPTEEAVLPKVEDVPPVEVIAQPVATVADRSSFQVYVRVKPLDEQDLAGNPSSRLRSITVSGNERIILSTRPSAKKENHGSKICFDFDHVLPESATQKDAYDVTTHSLVEQVLLGYHTCLITYGSASTGKSHSLFGKASSGKYKGLIIRASETLLHSIEKDTVENVKCKLTMSFIQVYNEKFYDILDPSATDNIRFHEFADISPLEGVTEMPVQTVDDVTKQLRRNPNRVRDAGRSHTVFTLHYKKEETDLEKNTIQVTDGRLEFTDLVGVNRSTKHSTHDVSGNSANAKANKSLQVFGNVVLTLAESSPQSTPYKDSKLTRLLREALGGNCITRLLVAASPCPNLTHETFCCLQFAQRAMTVVNHPEAHISFKEIPVQMPEVPCIDPAENTDSVQIESNTSTSLPPINLKSGFATPDLPDAGKEKKRASKDDREKDSAKKKKRGKGKSSNEVPMSESENPGSPPLYWQINKDGTNIVSGGKVLTLPHIDTPDVARKDTASLSDFATLEAVTKSRQKNIGKRQQTNEISDASKIPTEHGNSRSPTPPKEAFSKVVDGRQRNSVPVALRKDERKEAFGLPPNSKSPHLLNGRSNSQTKLSRPSSSSTSESSGCCSTCIEREDKIKNDYDRMILFSKKDRDAKQAKITQLEQLLVKIQNETAPLSEFQALRENKVKDRQRIEKLLSEQARLEALVEGCKSKMSQMVSLTEVANLQELRRKESNVMEVQKKKIEELSKNLQEQTKGATLMLAKKTEQISQLQADLKKLKSETKTKELEAKSAFSDCQSNLNKSNLEREKVTVKYENAARETSIKLKSALKEVETLKNELNKNKLVEKQQLTGSTQAAAVVLLATSKSDTELIKGNVKKTFAEVGINTEDYRDRLSGLAYYVHCLKCAATRAMESGELGDAPDVRDAELSILLTQDAKNREVLIQLKRERNLLRDVMKIMYCRQWFTEEGKPHVKRTLRRVGIDTRELKILQALPV
ncbi:uncharacterized protein LOC100178231, partial [Ciona intestinalis]